MSAISETSPESVIIGALLIRPSAATGVPSAAVGCVHLQDHLGKTGMQAPISLLDEDFVFFEDALTGRSRLLRARATCACRSIITRDRSVPQSMRRGTAWSSPAPRFAP